MSQVNRLRTIVDVQVNDKNRYTLRVILSIFQYDSAGNSDENDDARLITCTNNAGVHMYRSYDRFRRTKFKISLFK